MAYENIHFVVNPVSGGGQPPFDLFGEYMANAGIKTAMHVTQESHSVEQCVADALDANADLIIAYGGDGTVMTVANCLHDHKIPLAIVPGGTANIIAHELHIPMNPKPALELIFNEENEPHWLDAGCINNQEHFILRMSLGWEAEFSQRPTKEAKSIWGPLAYTNAALGALQELEPITYNLTLDDKTIQEQGINCSVCNIGIVGMGGLSLGFDVDHADGLLDVLILPHNNLQGFMDVLKGLVADNTELNVEDSIIHHRAKKIKISPTQPQLMSNDGEKLETELPITIECIPNYISILAAKNLEEKTA